MEDLAGPNNDNVKFAIIEAMPNKSNQPAADGDGSGQPCGLAYNLEFSARELRNLEELTSDH